MALWEYCLKTYSRKHLQIALSLGANLQHAEASWIAYERDPPGIHSGVIEFDNSESEMLNVAQNRQQTEKTSLGDWQIKMVYVAFSKIAFDAQEQIGLSISTRYKTSNSSFDIDVETPRNGFYHEAKVSWLAVCG